MQIITPKSLESIVRDLGHEAQRQAQRVLLKAHNRLLGLERDPRYMNFTGPMQITNSATGDFTTDAKHAIGTQGITRDGRKFRYVKAGAVALVSGNVIQGPAVVVNHLGLTPAAMAIGATSGVAALGATAAAANLYAGGYMQVDTTPGNGRMYSVSGHAAVLSSGNITAFFDVSDPIAVALTTSSRVGFHQNVHNGVIQMPITTATGKFAGVAVSDIPIANFGWVQTYGPCAVLINGTPALGAGVLGVSGTTAGSVDIETAAPAIVGQKIGVMMQIGVSGKNNAVFLYMD